MTLTELAEKANITIMEIVTHILATATSQFESDLAAGIANFGSVSAAIHAANEWTNPERSYFLTIIIELLLIRASEPDKVIDI